MKKLIYLSLLLLFTSSVWADDSSVALEKAPINRSDKNSIARGAAFFSTVCMACHTLIYLRYDPVAIKAGITYEKMPLHVKWPAGSVPPDLSLIADVRGVNWLYTYLHSFYTDTTRPTGVNNLLVQNTMMPAILVPYQGPQARTVDLQLISKLSHQYQWYDLLTLQKQGSMTPQQFDETMADVVNFLAYAAEPFHEQQVRIGYGVLMFLLVFLVLAYLLKREYWKDVK